MSLELNSCVLIDYRLWAAKSEGRPWVDQCLDHHLNLHLNLGVGCAPSCWPIFGFRTSWVLGGAQRAVFCAVCVADFLAEGAGWGASPGRGGESGRQKPAVPVG